MVKVAAAVILVAAEVVAALGLGELAKGGLDIGGGQEFLGSGQGDCSG
jgi:hypothetical protein